jgi:hypothetical protein
VTQSIRNLHLPRATNLQSAMIEGKLVALELHNGFGAYQRGRTFRTNSYSMAALGLDQEIREPGKIAEIAGAGLPQVPPSPWSRARPVVWAVRVLDPMRIIMPQTKLRHLIKQLPPFLRTDFLEQGQLAEFRVGIGLRDDRYGRTMPVQHWLQARAKSMKPCWTSVRISLTRSLSPTSRP